MVIFTPTLQKVGVFCYTHQMNKSTVNVAHARNNKELYTKIQKDGVCPFCVDFSKKRDVFEYHTKPALIHGIHWAVTENIDPYIGTQHHFIFVHRKHIISFSEATPAALKELGQIIKTLEERYKLPAGVLLMRFGDTNYTGGSVDHFHGHFILGAKKKNGDNDPLLLFAGYKKTGK